MPIPVVCPSCATKLRAPDNMVGHKTKCPKCGTAVIVPSRGTESLKSSRPQPHVKSFSRAEPADVRANSHCRAFAENEETHHRALVDEKDTAGNDVTEPQKRKSNGRTRVVLLVGSGVGLLLIIVVIIAVVVMLCRYRPASFQHRRYCRRSVG